MSKPHKHAEIIKAWADGAEIQARNFSNLWFDIPNATSGLTIDWGLHYDYRIKPAEKVVRWQWILKRGNGAHCLTSVFCTEDEIIEWVQKTGYTIIGKAEWARMEFDE